MTIREFARLCSSTPQTLRYYDQTGLLKPARVDPWTGYRHYEEEQALTFVKIKNLQAAGFTIEEIKALPDRDPQAVLGALEAKIAEAEARLRKIKEIRCSYQTEMTQMKEKIEETRKRVVASMESFDSESEFGIAPEAWRALTREVERLFEKSLPAVPGVWPFPASSGDAMTEDEESYEKLLEAPGYKPVYEKHGWRFVKDFLPEFSSLEDGGEYLLLFRLRPEKTETGAAFSCGMLHLLLEKNPGKKKTVSCHVFSSPDGENHFLLLKKLF